MQTTFCSPQVGTGDLRLAHVLLAYLWCKQGKPEGALSYWCVELQHVLPSHNDATIQRVGFHPGTALLCHGIAMTLFNPSGDAYHTNSRFHCWIPARLAGSGSPVSVGMSYRTIHTNVGGERRIP
ncbi:hypothetical protein [Ktedonospora formicarum]|uniref:hypothetical protein n=1 Tax=Ktedonospora formicarum TaxID=2778364 RepID=UPI001C68C463|nr:hypothetical protein [Ktedonospora formicarum]